MVCIEMKGKDGWERVRGKYANERDAQKAIATKKEEAARARPPRPAPEFRVVPFEKDS